MGFLRDSPYMIRRLTIRLLPILLLAGAASVAWRLAQTAKPPVQEPAARKPPQVIAGVVQPQDYQVTVLSQGDVRARTESTLIPEVSGVVASIAPSLREGGFFELGEELLKLDDRDYQTTVVVSQSALAQAETALSEESARAEQARDDWKALHRTGKPSPLLMREPQVHEARLRVDSAKAQLEKSRRDLERTSLRAPFAGRVLRKMADVGQYVSPGRELARIFAVDTAEIDLAVTNEDLAFLQLPEDYRGDAPGMAEVVRAPSVILRAEYGGRSGEWVGRLVRAAGSIDRNSRQLFLTAQVDDPYKKLADDAPPLKVGMFVEAQIKGDTLQDVFVIPRSAVRDGDHVLIVDHEKKLRTRKVGILRGEKDHVIVNEGLHAGETICIMSMEFAVEGLVVNPVIQPLPGAPGKKDGEGKAASPVQTQSLPNGSKKAGI